MYKILANTLFLGKDIHFLPDCHSTNDMALQALRQNQAAEGSIFITNHQTRGKGQRGNSWETKPGENLTFSLVLQPRFLDLSEQLFTQIQKPRLEHQRKSQVLSRLGFPGISTLPLAARLVVGNKNTPLSCLVLA